jgi:hypothetical protein
MMDWSAACDLLIGQGLAARRASWGARPPPYVDLLAIKPPLYVGLLSTKGRVGGLDVQVSKMLVGVDSRGIAIPWEPTAADMRALDWEGLP